MQTLVVEDDPIMQELLASVLRSLHTSVAVRVTDNIESALKIWREHKLELILCDWHLSNTESGSELVQTIRKAGDQTPIVMISGHRDRNIVVSSLRHGANEYIIKPFSPEDVARRLAKYLPLVGNSGPAATGAPDLIEWLGDMTAVFPRLSLARSNAALAAQIANPEDVSARELAKQWVSDLAVTTHLIRVANSSLLRRYGKTVSTLLEAISAMGVQMAISQVLAISLNDHKRLSVEQLVRLSQTYGKEAELIAEKAAVLASERKRDAALAYTSGLMYRLGEQAVLEAIQLYYNEFGTLSEEITNAALKACSVTYGNKLKALWHLPAAIRERVGAAHRLAKGSVQEDLLIMRAAAYQIAGEVDNEEYKRLCSLLGLPISEPATPTATRESAERSGPTPQAT